MYCPWIPQGLPDFFFPQQVERKVTYFHIWEKSSVLFEKGAKQDSRFKELHLACRFPHPSTCLNSCRSDACWKVYRPLLNGPVSEMDEIQWWQINAASYLMAPHVNNPVHHQVCPLCCSSWFLSWAAWQCNAQLRILNTDFTTFSLLINWNCPCAL